MKFDQASECPFAERLDRSETTPACELGKFQQKSKHRNVKRLKVERETVQDDYPH